MNCELTTPIEDFKCQASLGNVGKQKFYIVEEGDVLKVHKPNGLQLGDFVGYGKWTKDGSLLINQNSIPVEPKTLNKNPFVSEKAVLRPKTRKKS
ncbi:MAG TPA: hypothetical protein VGF79_00890 [Bacteroidia bacterium]